MMRLAAADARRLDAVQADPADADHHDVGVRAHGGTVHHRAVAGDHAAGEDGGDVEGQVPVHLDDLRAMHRGIFGEGGGLQALKHRRAVTVEDLRATAPLEPMLAAAAVAERAAGADPAGSDHGDDHMIARFDVRDTSAPTASTTPAPSCP